MSILEKAAPPKKEALIVTLCGEPGSGKTSCACTWPKPFLIRTQGEAVPRDIDPDNTPMSIGETTSEELLHQQLLALIRDDHEYKTVIIDSITGLEQMFISEILAEDPKARGINQAFGGYGNGHAAVAAKHARVRKAAEMLRQKGINVVFLAHSDITRIDPPDGDGYTQYGLRLNSKSTAPYVDSVDVVGQIKLQRAVIQAEGEHKRAIGTGSRVLVTYLTPSAVTKNRLGIDDDIEVVKGVNPLAQWIAMPRKSSAKKDKLSATEALQSSVNVEEMSAEDFQ